MDAKADSGVRALIRSRRDQMLHNPAVLSYYIPEFGLGPKAGQGALVLDSWVTMPQPRGFGLWQEGLHLIRCAFDRERRSFIDPIFRSIQPKISFEFLSTTSAQLRVSNVDWNEKVRTVRIEFEGPQIPLPNGHVEECQDQRIQLRALIDRAYIWSEMAFAQCTQPSIKEHVSALESAVSKDKEPFADPVVAEVLNVGFAFAYPSTLFPKKAFTALVVPSYKLDGEEVTYEGLVVFWDPVVEDGKTWLDEQLLVWTGLLSGQRTTALLLDRAATHARTAAEGAVMARNMSHNLGSHALAKISAKFLKVHSQQTEGFLGYVQRRMDFVARVATEWPSWSQPMLFYRDLIWGFLEQEVLLDNLLADDGYSSSLVSFALGGNGVSTTFVNVKLGSTPEGGVPSGDFLVSVPGGLVGAQAFYAFLENALRNAARHNERSNTGMTAFLTIADHGDSFLFRYWDSLSKDSDGSIRKEVSATLIDPLVNPETGTITGKHWGIHEMKVCARFLAYSPDSDSHWRERLNVAKGVTVEGVGPVLGYEFSLQKAILVAVLDFNDGKEAPPYLCEVGVRRVRLDPVDESSSKIAVDLIRKLSPVWCA